MTQVWATIKRTSRYYGQQRFEYNTKRPIPFRVGLIVDSGGEYHVQGDNQYRIKDVNLYLKRDDGSLIKIN